MKGNPIVWLIFQIVVVMWIIYQLTAPGEAQNQIVVIMEYVALVGVSLGIIGSIVMVVGRKQRG
jgi:hypothetical protein